MYNWDGFENHISSYSNGFKKICYTFFSNAAAAIAQTNSNQNGSKTGEC